MKKAIYIVFTFLNFLCHSQVKKQAVVYLDENKKEISKSYYDKKCKTYVLKCQKYDSKNINVTLFKVNNRYKFGKLEPEEYNQIRTLLAKDSKTKIEANKTIIIKYLDTLRNYDIALEDRKRHFKNYHEQEFKEETFQKKDFDKERQLYIKKKYKCVKDYEGKYNTKLIHVYKFGDNAVESYGKLNMLKDRGIIKRLFFRNIHENHLVVLKPDGDYLLIGGHLSNKDLGKLIKNEDWSKYKSQLNISINEKRTLGYGIFKKVTGYHKKHCF